jgi:hypothetical protein
MQYDIDITFDFRQDTPGDKDPDRYSKTVRRYHKQLWSKPLPSGASFQLRDHKPGHYLYHKSDLGEFSLTSDAVIPSFRWRADILSMTNDAELQAFTAKGYTIGGMMVFPGNQINRKWTINQARGCTRSIGDRFDLTLECIRRHYAGEASPLAKVLMRYDAFFKLFTDFRGYVEFFHLQDLVTHDYRRVMISQPYRNFSGSPIPASPSEYEAYKTDMTRFIDARNQRIMQSF